MRSKILSYISVLSLCFSGCGLLGNKDAPEAKSNVSATGCLNESKDLIGRYVDGKMTQTEWKSAFDCINKSLDFFTDFVRGSGVDSYTQGDMYELVTKFLITNGKVRPDLMRGAFNLKMALFGGDVKEFKKDEVELLKRSLTRLHDITSDLIPYLQLRQNPNADLSQVLEMVPAFKRAGDQLADFINTLPTNIMSSSAMDLLFNELTYTLSLSQVDNLGEKVSVAKWLLFNTRRDAFEPYDWAQIFRDAFGLGGIMLAIKTAGAPAEVCADPNNTELKCKVFQRLGEDYRFRDFFWELLQQAKPYFTDALKRHNGSAPLPIFDHVIDNLPKGMLDSVPKQVLKNVIRPMVMRLFGSESEIGFDNRTIDNVYGLVENVVKDLGVLDRFYEKAGINPESVEVKQFKTTMQQYEGSISGDELRRFKIIEKAIGEQPALMQSNGFARYTPNLGYSLTQHRVVLAFRNIINFIHTGYGSGDDHFLEADFVQFFADYTELLYAFKLVDITVAGFGKRRFSDLDLFTSLSNGDNKAQVPEITTYAMTLVSSGKMTSKMKNEIWAACPTDHGMDNMDSRWIEGDCFRRQYNERLDYWLDNFPRFKAYWVNLLPDDKLKAMKWLEHGARRNGYTGDLNQPQMDWFGSFDFQAMATVIHYTEALFTRFDGNSNEVLSKTEVNNAFGLFKGLIQTKAKDVANVNITSNYILEAVFSYIVRYRSMPVLSLSQLGNTAQFVWWLAVYALPTTNYSADRIGVFNIVCQLAVPDSDDQKKRTKDICAP